MKEQCQKIRNMILNGTDSAEVTEHMKVCDECRMLAESMVYFKEHSLPQNNMSQTPPAHVGDFIKAAARQKLKNNNASKRSKFLRITFEIGSMAALFVFAMVILYQQPEENTETPVQQAAVQNTEIITVTMESELDQLHAELADISDDLNDYNEVADFSPTDPTQLSQLSQLELDYALYQANL